MVVDNQLRFKSHKNMHMEFILNIVDVMTQGCLSSACGPNIRARLKGTNNVISGAG